MKANWSKFQIFIREKQGKVEEGQRRVEWEQEQQEGQDRELGRLAREGMVHRRARDLLKGATTSRWIRKLV